MLCLWAAVLLQTWDLPKRPAPPPPVERLRRYDLPDRRRDSDYERRAREWGGGADTESVVAASLKSLAERQAEDGSWEPAQGGSRLEVTALALLAFHHAGYWFWDQKILQWPPDYRARGWLRIPGRDGGPSYHQTVRRAYRYLTDRQGPDGFVGDRSGPRAWRDHAIATRVFCELHAFIGRAMTAGPAEDAIDALLTGPLPSGREDPEAVAWAALALRSATLGMIPYDRAALERFVGELETFGGDVGSKGAVDLLLWNVMRGVTRLPERLYRHPPSRTLPSTNARDWLWGTVALLLWDGPKGVTWAEWNGRMKTTLLAGKGGTAEDLALRALTLEVYFWVWHFGWK